jgi:hypothetical protein
LAGGTVHLSQPDPVCRADSRGHRLVDRSRRRDSDPYHTPGLAHPNLDTIPWQGDEEYHIAIAGGLAKAAAPLLQRAPLLVLLAAITGMGAVIFLIWKRNSTRLTIMAFATVLLPLPIAALTVPQLRIPSEVLLRYPFLEYWTAAVPPLLGSFVIGKAAFFTEPLYRIIPLASVILLAWVVQRPVARLDPWAGLLFGIVTITTPLAYYYSSILYLELPAAVLMTYVCLHADALLTKDKQEVLQHPAWYALLITGFLKETVVPFIAVFVLLRPLIRLMSRKRTYWTVRHFADELAIIFSAAAPLFIYIVLRKTFGDMRAYEPHLENLLDLSVYATLARSYGSQFGALSFVAIAGLCILIRRKSYVAAVFLTGAFAADAAFHILDSKNYLGYSRFNLFLLPPLLAAAATAVATLARQYGRWSYGVLAGLMIANLWMSPVYLDGSKVPRWDAYRIDTAEHYYPYDEALRWLKKNYADQEIWFTGLRYHYTFGFYFKKLDWHPSFEQRVDDNRSKNDDVAVEAALKTAAANDAKVVVFQADGKALPRPADAHHFHVARVFANDATRLIVYTRTPGTPQDH